jgi:2-succinyl-5-enolpyruvyl-6-hydroxy-3-cyclohexene-1-carboxylate synthase
MDERSAAFFALGLSKATARPVAVACTSGTAAAEFLPAVVEASMSRTRLVALTADRPPELRGIGANQTIDQPGIYGTYVSASTDAEVPGDRPEEAYWRRLAAGALASAFGPPPGPTHINLPFREPLVPGPVELPESPPGGSPREHAVRPEPAEVERLRGELTAAVRGVFLAGSLRRTPHAVVELARRASWPLVAEPTSGLRIPGALTAGQSLLADERFASSNVPEAVVQLGAAPTSRPALELVARAERLVVVDPDHLVADPHRRAAWTIRADPTAVAEEILEALPRRSATTWLHDWLAADARARSAIDATMDGWNEPSEGRVARDVAAALPDGSVLVVGSSMPVRDLDATMAPREGIEVLANRGASGIDGFVSTVLGVAAAGRPAVALCGDLTLLHDAGALLWSARGGPDATFVVLNNGGGTIFSFLPQRELPELEPLFSTPHGMELAARATGAGAGHDLVTAADQVAPALERSVALGGVGLVEVVVDPERNRACHAEMASEVATALAGIG